MASDGAWLSLMEIIFPYGKVCFGKEKTFCLGFFFFFFNLGNEVENHYDNIGPLSYRIQKHCF